MPGRNPHPRMTFRRSQIITSAARRVSDAGCTRPRPTPPASDKIPGDPPPRADPDGWELGQAGRTATRTRHTGTVPSDPAVTTAAPPRLLTSLNDRELIEAARAGDLVAYGELYRRHVDAGRNLARQLARCPSDADDLIAEGSVRVMNTILRGNGPTTSFRAYLLTAIRHVAYDKWRRDRKQSCLEDLAMDLDGATLSLVTPFVDTALVGLERGLAAQAFARLRERWQAVLWHIEIEGHTPAEVAPILGLTANGVSALAYRAREGLRQAYLQVHLAETTDRHCRAAAERLGAWTRSGLAKREKAQVDTHLDTCERCLALAAELRHVNEVMGRCA